MNVIAGAAITFKKAARLEAAEETRQHAHGQEEAGFAGDPVRPVRRQAA